MTRTTVRLTPGVSTPLVGDDDEPLYGDDDEPLTATDPVAHDTTVTVTTANRTTVEVNRG